MWDSYCIGTGTEIVCGGDHIRIDAFTLITCKKLVLGDYVHIGPHCSISGPGTVYIGSYSTLSHGVRIFTASDDYEGEYLAGPMLPEGYTKPTVGDVTLEKGVVVGANSVILPGIVIGHHSALGALSLLKQSIWPLEIWAGVPARFLKERNEAVLLLTQQLEEMK